MHPTSTESRSTRRPLAPVVIACYLLLAGCSFQEPVGPKARGSALATLNKLAGKDHVQTGTILAADLDKMSRSGEAFYDGRILQARMHNHLANPLGKVTLRLVMTKGKQIREDVTFVRKLLAAPHSPFQLTVKVKRPPREGETWAWCLMSGDKGKDPR